MSFEDEDVTVDSDEDDRDGGEEDTGGLGAAHQLAADLHGLGVLQGEGEVEVDQVDQVHGHGQGAQQQVRDGQVDNQQVLGGGQDLFGDIDNDDGDVAEEADDDQDAVQG